MTFSQLANQPTTYLEQRKLRSSGSVGAFIGKVLLVRKTNSAALAASLRNEIQFLDRRYH